MAIRQVRNGARSWQGPPPARVLVREPADRPRGVEPGGDRGDDTVTTTLTGAEVEAYLAALAAVLDDICHRVPTEHGRGVVVALPTVDLQRPERGAALFDGFHAAVSGPVDINTGATIRQLGPYSWLASRLFLGSVAYLPLLLLTMAGATSGAAAGRAPARPRG
mgnify:CR=1 FL=1